MGGSVKKGSKGYLIAFWGKHEVEDRNDPDKTKAVPFLKFYTVFKRILHVADGLIAATAVQHGFHLMTRNIADVEVTGALLLNPWD